MSVIRESIVLGEYPNPNFEEIGRKSTIDNLMDKMMTSDLIIEEYYGRPMIDLDGSQDSFETQMQVFDAET